MSHTKKINDNCYFQTLCNDSKRPGEYKLSNIQLQNFNECYPNETPLNTTKHIANINIENNLFNLDKNSDKCVNGNTLDDKNSRVNVPINTLQDCGFNMTQFTRNNLNLVNRGNVNSFDTHPLNNNPYGNYMDLFNNGIYGLPRCSNMSNTNCVNFGSNIQSRSGMNTTLNAKDNHAFNINNNQNHNGNFNDNLPINNVDLPFESNLDVSNNCSCNF